MKEYNYSKNCSHIHLLSIDLRCYCRYDNTDIYIFTTKKVAYFNDFGDIKKSISNKRYTASRCINNIS